MKILINCISLIRIPLAIAMLFNYSNNKMLFILLLIAGLSDILDGYLARKLHLTSKIGAKIDTIADFATFIVITYILVLNLYTITKFIYFVIFIMLLKAICLLICYIKYKDISFRHTLLNKLTGFVFIVTTLFYFLTLNYNCYFIVISLAILSSIEEIIINILSNKLDLDLKSIFKLKI